MNGLSVQHQRLKASTRRLRASETSATSPSLPPRAHFDVVNSLILVVVPLTDRAPTRLCSSPPNPA